MEIKVGETVFSLTDELCHKLDIMSDRVIKPSPKWDACLANSGNEGEGKTNMSIIEAAYIKQKTGFPISLFFKTSSCIKFAQETEQQIIILDEPVFDLLSTDFATTIYKDFTRLTSTMRKKRHFLIINFAKFWKFPEFLVVDRALGMVHLFSNQGRDIGKFYYIKKNKLETLWNNYHKDKKRSYGKLKSFRGRVTYVMEKIFKDLDITVENIPHATVQDYEREKDRAIESIGVKDQKKDKYLVRLEDLRYKLTRIPKVLPVTSEQLANALGISSTRLREWAKLDLKPTFSLENEPFEADNQPFTLDTRSDGSDFLAETFKQRLKLPATSEIEPKNEPYTSIGSQKTPQTN